MAPLAHFKGPCSWFGGPDDDGVSPDEGLAFFYEVSDAPHLFLAEQPPGTTGLARRLNPEEYYVACRWDYDTTPKDMLRKANLRALVRARGKEVLAWPADWGPHQDTGRAADLSPALLEALGLTTDDVCEVTYPIRDEEEEEEEVAMRIAISSGHGRLVRGASGVLDEVNEARRVVERVAELLAERGVEVATFHDNVSDDQSENLNRIVDWHNEVSFGDGDHDLDVSVHFNAYEPTDKGMGSEVLYVTQEELAATLSDAISAALDLPDRGAKFRDDLFFLSHTAAPAVLLEVCFVDSTCDADRYTNNFDEVCEAIAATLARGDGEIA